MNKINIIAALAFFAVGLTSCLKEYNNTIDSSRGTANVVEFANTGDLVSVSSSTYPRFNIDLGKMQLNETKDFNINISYSGVNSAPSDITVDLAIDEAGLTQFNTENNTHYSVPTSDIFSFPTKAVIKKGEKSVTLTATIKLTSTFDFEKAYALPIKIANASTGVVSHNFGMAVYSFGVQNLYDGIYSIVSGYVQRYSAPGVPTTDALNGNLAGNPDLTLSTVNATTVEISNMRWYGGSSGVAGIDHTQATIDPTTNLVTMKSLGNATLTNWAGKDNKYDPATQTLTLNFRWNPTGAVREMTLVIKYSKPR